MFFSFSSFAPFFSDFSEKQTKQVTFWHSIGSKSPGNKDLDGLFGLIDVPPETPDKVKLRNAVIWLLKENPHFQKYHSFYETIPSFFPPSSSLSSYSPLPTTERGVNVESLAPSGPSSVLVSNSSPALLLGDFRK